MSWKLNKANEVEEIRKIYGLTLESLIKEGKPIMVCDADLAGSSGASFIYTKYPNNSVNFGICEANMIAAAAAMSMTGLKPYVHSFAPFVSRRVADQLYVSAGFAKNDIHIYATDPGYWSQYNGATHTTFEDLAIMRSIPGVNIVAPSDAVQFKWVLEYYEEHGGIFYNRCTRKPIPKLYEDGSTFEFGKALWTHKGTDVALIAIGASVNDAIQAREELSKLGISASVIDLFFVKPIDEELIKQVIREHKSVVTIENHNRFGGIGEHIGSIIANEGVQVKLRQVCVNDRYGEVGDFKYLKETFKLTKEDIVIAAINSLNK